MQQENNQPNKFFTYLHSIKTKLIFSFLLITLTPLIYISYVMLENATNGLLNVIVSNSLAHARKASTDMNNFVAHQLEILKPLINSEKAQRPDSEEFKKVIEDFDNQHLSIEKHAVARQNADVGVADKMGVGYAWIVRYWVSVIGEWYRKSGAQHFVAYSLGLQAKFVEFPQVVLVRNSNKIASGAGHG